MEMEHCCALPLPKPGITINRQILSPLPMSIHHKTLMGYFKVTINTPFTSGWSSHCIKGWPEFSLKGTAGTQLVICCDGCSAQGNRLIEGHSLSFINTKQRIWLTWFFHLYLSYLHGPTKLSFTLKSACRRICSSCKAFVVFVAFIQLCSTGAACNLTFQVNGIRMYN